MPQYGWHINLNNCIACRACEGGCKQEFLLPKGVRRRKVIVQEGVVNLKPYRRFITSACMHCLNPACVPACPVNRYWKDTTANGALRTAFGMAANPTTGLVLIKPSRAEDPVNGVDCVGCKRCISACPYGAPQYDEQTKTVDKCTGCYHRLFNTNLPAEKRIPACALTCTSFTLHFDDMARITEAVYGVGNVLTTTNAPAGAKDIYNPTVTVPSVRFAPQRNIG